MGVAKATATGVLLMAYGGPDSLADVELYLLDVRGGRPTPQALVEEIRHRYEQIGGRSPLLEITRKQAKALEVALNRQPQKSSPVKVYVGMRHWEPRIRQAVEEMKADGIREAVALVMAPHYSKMSIEVYLQRLEEALRETQADISFTPVRSWYQQLALIQALAGKVLQGFAKFEGTIPYVLFTAHSLPASILETGDPYPDQLMETARRIAEILGLDEKRWSFSFQSAGKTGTPWLGPSIETEIPRLIQAGERNILAAPIGFVTDHVEVLYDLDIEAKALATALGGKLERTESQNDSPEFIEALVQAIQSTQLVKSSLQEGS